MITYEVKVHDSGNKKWYLNNQLHREDGPAYECTNGTNHWYINGELHREDGPAIEETNGNKYWYLNGERHREDGPAIEHIDGYKSWFLNNEILTEKEFNARMNPKVTELTLEEIASKLNIPVDQLRIKD